MTNFFRTKVNQTGRDRKKLAAGSWSKMNRPPEGEPFTWLTREMLSSPAFTALSRRAYLVLFRILLEHMAHAGRANGLLVVSHGAFAAYGIPDGTQAEAIREAVALGWVAVTEKGRLSYGSVNRATRFRLTFLPTASPDSCTTWPATNEWKVIASAEDAKHKLKQCRKTSEASTASPSHATNSHLKAQS
jgi:hypothetical protein